MALKQFQAESKRLMDLMINSIYTHKEIFLRELISNASDAVDKLYYQALSQDITGLSREDFFISVRPDKEKRTLTVSDNGIGMTQEELDDNLGVIAKSGSLKFKGENEKKEDIDIIGQFGVGFYSAFMVARRVEVKSRAYGSDQTFSWVSEGLDGYEIAPCQKDSHGTEITLYLKEDTEEERYGEFLDQYRIMQLVRKYSDYIRYPIIMDCERTSVKPGTGTDGKDPEYETVVETRTLNSMTPIWKKSRSEVTDEEYGAFYKEKFMDWQDPLKVIRTSTEGTATYTALMFVPQKPPMDYYSRDYEKGLQLYSNGVMIMEKCADLLPDCFSFMKGLVDSQDLSLNISREMLQHDRQLKLIADRLEKKIASELRAMLDGDRENYEKFFDSFGLQLKFGIYNDYGLKKELLKDLVLFYSSTEKKLSTLKEYVARMKEGQQYIYYGCGESSERIMQLPQAIGVGKKGYEILCLTADVDEFALRVLEKYEDKEFKNISSDKLELETEEEKKEMEELSKNNEELLSRMQKVLEGKVTSVRLSSRLTEEHPVCLSTDGAISTEMERVLNSMPTGEKVKAQRVLEINAEHPVFAKLSNMDNDELFNDYTELLYELALLIEGLPVEDPVEFSRKVCNIL